MRIDLHTHSAVSDGTDTPAELLTAAVAAGLDVVALTDHDTTDGWDVVRAARPTGLSVVPGMELSCRWFPAEGAPISVHLLAYLFDPLAPELAEERARLRAERLTRGERIVTALVADGYRVSWADIVERSAGEWWADRTWPAPSSPPASWRRSTRRSPARCTTPARTTWPRPTPTSSTASRWCAPRAGCRSSRTAWPARAVGSSATTPWPRWPPPACSGWRSTTPTTSRPTGCTCAAWPPTWAC
ncbi:PHP domain-containing protein [Klenkia terrae]|uniref:PHP domain-containing protein n=1 Tax=Klenkia terrae TaxID=1052259 RepID=UPI0036196F97